MAVSEYPPEAWQRLGRLLKSRRVHIDPAYKNRGAFCTATGLNYKLVQEVEGHTRTTFGDDTFALFETGYRLVEGSIRRALAGGDLEPADRDVVTLSVAAEAKAPAAEIDDDEEIDLDSFVPETPAERALMAIYRANEQARQDHQKSQRVIEEKLEHLTEQINRLSVVRDPGNVASEYDNGHDQQRKGA